ncbi:MAG: glycosyltransferase family 9 protein [Succinivibrio sp.]
MNFNCSDICVLRLTALGDCINAYGMIHAIKKSYPNANITWIIDSRFASLFRDQNSSIKVNLIEVNPKKDGLLNAYLKLRKELSTKKFDVLLDMQTSIKASIFSTAIKAQVKIGYDDDRRREFQGLFINSTITPPDSPHVLSGFMSFARSSGFDISSPLWDFYLTDEEIQNACELTGDESKIFAVAPASAKAEKNWTAEGYAKVIDHAIDKGFKVILLGSSSRSEIDLSNRILELSDKSEQVVNLMGKTSLRVLAAVISKCALVLSPDSAAMHLASALNVPVIGLFAIHDPDRVGAWNYRALEVSCYKQLKDLELKGGEGNWRYRVKTPNAMTHITSEMVLSAFDRTVTDYKIG